MQQPKSPAITVRTTDQVSRQRKAAPAHDWLLIAVIGLGLLALMWGTAALASYRGFGHG